MEFDALGKARCWLEIDTGNLKHNIEQIRALIPDRSELMPVLKANAYGHGSRLLAQKIVDWQLADHFALASLEEALELRQTGIASDLLVLGPLYQPAISYLAEYGVSQTISNYQEAKAVSDWARKHGQKIKVHLKIDTGMSRLGFPVRDGQLTQAVRDILEVSRLPAIDLEGIFTHFVASKGERPDLFDQQVSLFAQVIQDLTAQGVHFKYRHCSNSQAILAGFDRFSDLVRPGIILYGSYGSPCQEDFKLKPVMSFFSRVVAINHLLAGESVSYGPTFWTDRPSRIAVVEAGYADGYPRSLSNRGQVYIAGKACPVVGTVCMDRFMVDITDHPAVKLGDRVLLFGQDGNCSLPADAVADKAGTIAYELFCSINRRVTRFII